MSDQKIKALIKESVLKLINNTISDKKIKKIVSKHEVKTHFVPMKYRILGGLLQSLNIQFGNFIEVLIHTIVEREKGLEIITALSGRKNIPLSLSAKTDSLIDQFITERQVNTDKQLSKQFEAFLSKIVVAQKSNDSSNIKKHDIDVLFKDKKTNVMYYLEVKYDDNHDTGKFVDINRKFLKTYAGLVKTLNIKDVKQLKPILYYLNRKIMKGNIYVPEETHIYRGEKLFKEFFAIQYEDLDDCLKNVSEDEEIIAIFDNLYKKIRFGK